MSWAKINFERCHGNQARVIAIGPDEEYLSTMNFQELPSGSLTIAVFGTLRRADSERKSVSPENRGTTRKTMPKLLKVELP